ncbi:MAG: hypothetical protein OXU77_20200 [Gammaproteobacteria bacterium]|nr:hypothetical protein [Gammaproteobacteria bacterium]MDE0433148.1 hypothetical protein [Bryobacterales bacterium]
MSESRLWWGTEDQIRCASEVSLGGLVEAAHELAEPCSELIRGKSVMGGAANTSGDVLEVVTIIPPGQKQACAVVASPHFRCDFE